MKSIVLHAGLPKTGTSAVQAWLADNTEQLESVGVHYPWHEVDSNQVSAGNAGSLMADLDGPWVADQARLTETLEEFEESGCHTLLLSSEAFLPELPTLAKSLPDHARFVLYVRDPLEFLESDYNQRVKRLGHVEEFVPDPAAYGGWLGHEAFFEALRSPEMRPRLELRPYHKDLFVGGSLLTDLLTAVGVTPGLLSEVTMERINASYSLPALEMKRALNNLPLGKSLDERLDVCLQHCPIGPDTYTLIPPSDHERLRQQADDDLHTVALRYDIDSLEPLRKVLRQQPAKPYQPQRVGDDRIEAVADHLGRTAFRLVGRLALLLEQHPEVAFPYPTLRDALLRAEALDHDDPADQPRRWWQKIFG